MRRVLYMLAVFWGLSLLLPHSAVVQDRLQVLSGPGSGHWFGTDEFGRDVLARFLRGGCISLSAATLATLISLGIGWAAGAVAGYRGGWADRAMLRVSELFLALPWLYALLAFRAALPLGLNAALTFLMVSALLGSIGWAGTARIIRNTVAAAVQSGYVEAAKGFGASQGYILRRHVFPETRARLETQFGILLPHYLAAEVTLAFLGLGISEPLPSWGSLLLILRQANQITEHPHLAIPIFLMFLIFFPMKQLSASVDPQ